MLAITRKVGQGVVIDGGIRVVVISAGGRYVRLGFEAPRGLRIVRDELEVRIDLDPCNGCPLRCPDCLEPGKVPPCQRPQPEDLES